MRAVSFTKTGRHHRPPALTIRAALIWLAAGAVLGALLLYLINSQIPAQWCT